MPRTKSPSNDSFIVTTVRLPKDDLAARARRAFRWIAKRRVSPAVPLGDGCRGGRQVHRCGGVMAMNTLEILLTEISVPRDRLRALRPDNVDAIAESMGAQGQIQSIIVRQRAGGGYSLIVGRHRLEAARKLGWREIRCGIMEGIDADQIELIEIDENLIRAELSPAESAMHLTRRKELYERLHPETKHGGDRKSSAYKSSSQGEKLKTFVEDTASKTGKGRSTVARDVARGKNVKVLADIAGTSLDQGRQLDMLAKLPEDEQRALAARAKAGEKVSASTSTDSVKEAADRAERSAAAKAAKSREPKLTRTQQEFRDQPEKAANAKAATEVSQQIADLVERFGKIDLSPIEHMSGDERTDLMGQIARATARLNEIAMKIAISGGAGLTEFDDPSLRYAALSFMENATARIRAELTGRREVPESVS